VNTKRCSFPLLNRRRPWNDGSVSRFGSVSWCQVIQFTLREILATFFILNLNFYNFLITFENNKLICSGANICNGGLVVRLTSHYRRKDKRTTSDYYIFLLEIFGKDVGKLKYCYCVRMNQK